MVHSVVVTTTKQSTSSYQFEDVSVTCKSYFWKGQHTSPKVLMAWKLFFGKMVEERLVQKIGMLPEKIEVDEQKEPMEFLQLFENHITILQGRTATTVPDSLRVSRAPLLLQIKASADPPSVRGVEARPVASSLNSGDVFVLLLERKLIAWIGMGAQTLATNFLGRLPSCLLNDREVEKMAEGSETEEFWESLCPPGAQSSRDYYSSGMLCDQKRVPFCRLLSFERVNRHVRMEEVHSFAPCDLDPHRVCLLDCVSALFLWVGRAASKELVDSVTELSSHYRDSVASKDDPSLRSCAGIAELPIEVVLQGEEPLSFICHFQGWKPLPSDSGETRGFVDPYDIRLRENQKKGMRQFVGSVVEVSSPHGHDKHHTEEKVTSMSDSDSDSSSEDSEEERPRGRAFWRQRIAESIARNAGMPASEMSPQ